MDVIGTRIAAGRALAQLERTTAELRAATAQSLGEDAVRGIRERSSTQAAEAVERLHEMGADPIAIEGIRDGAAALTSTGSHLPLELALQSAQAAEHGKLFVTPKEIGQHFFHQDATSLTRENWASLRTQLDEYGPEALGVPAEIGESKPITEIAAEISDGIYTADSPHVRIYFDTAQVAALSDAERTSQAHTLLKKQPELLSLQEWTRLEALVRSDPDNVRLGVPNSLPNHEDFTTIARRLGGPEQASTDTALPYFKAFEVGTMSEAQRAETFDALLSENPDTMTADHWSMIGALLNQDPQSKLHKVPREIEGSKSLSEIANDIVAGEYTGRDSAHVDVYFEAAHAIKMSNAERIERAHSLMRIHPEDLTKSQWTELEALLHLDPDNSVLRIPREIEDAKPLTEIARDIASGQYKAGSRYIQAYFTTFRTSSLTDPERVALLDSILAKKPGDVTKEEWNDIAALLTLDTSATLHKVPRQIEGAKPLRQIATEVANGSYEGGKSPHIRIYFEAAQVAKLNNQQRIEQAHALMGRDPADLKKGEWSRLEALLQADPYDELLNIPREVEGAKPLTEIARDIAGGEYKGTSPYVRSYFDSFALRSLSDAERRTRADSLMSRPATDLTHQEWSSLRSLLLSDPEDALLNIPREIEGSKSLVEIAGDISKGDYTADSPYVEIYFTHWQRRNDPGYTARLETAVAAVLGGHTDDATRKLVADEADRLPQLLKDRSALDQATILEVILGTSKVGNRDQLKTLLTMLKSTVEDMTVDDASASLCDETLTLIDRNISRLEGHTPDDAIVGYSNYPDFGEIGTIRAHLNLIQSLTPQSSPPPQASVVGEKPVTW